MSEDNFIRGLVKNFKETILQFHKGNYHVELDTTTTNKWAVPWAIYGTTHSVKYYKSREEAEPEYLDIRRRFKDMMYNQEEKQKIDRGFNPA